MAWARRDGALASSGGRNRRTLVGLDCFSNREAVAGTAGKPSDEWNLAIARLGELLQHVGRLPGLPGQLREVSQMKMNRSRYFIALLTSIAGLAFSGSATSTLA